MTHSQGNFRQRGEAMSRIETFVAAAFAFAVTMLVIALDEVPKTFEQLLTAVKMIPSFAASCACLIWIWHAHATWSRRYGLEDGPSVFLSAILVFLILIYIYPLRAVMQGMFAFVSGGYLPSELVLDAGWQVRFMFVFYGTGFLLLSLNFLALYGYALRQRETLALNRVEEHDTFTEMQLWAIVALVSLSSIIMAMLLPFSYFSLAGFVYFLLFPFLTAHGFLRGYQRRKHLSVQPGADNRNNV